MDEPLSNLDAKLRVQMRAEIARIQRDLGVTTIYVTHDQVEAMTLGDRVAVMRGGVLQQVDTPQALYEQPRQPVRRRLHRLARDEPRRGDPRTRPTVSGSRSEPPPPAFPRAARERARLSLARSGAPVVLGIRPDDFEDAALVAGRAGRRAPAVDVDLRETLGREAYLHFVVDAPPVLTEDTKELAADTDVAALEELERTAATRRRALSPW